MSERQETWQREVMIEKAITILTGHIPPDCFEHEERIYFSNGIEWREMLSVPSRFAQELKEKIIDKKRNHMERTHDN